MNSLLDPLANGFMLGLATGPLCMGSCFPVLISLALGEAADKSPVAVWGFLGKFIAGRFFAYTAAGFAVGLLGSTLGTSWRLVGVLAWLLMAAILIAYGMGVGFAHFGLCAVAGRFAGTSGFPFLMGGLTGLNVCPPFLLAITFTLERSIEPSYGAVFFMAFFFATTLFILPAGMAGYLPRHDLMTRFGKIAAVVAGVVFLYQGVSIIVTG